MSAKRPSLPRVKAVAAPPSPDQDQGEGWGRPWGSALRHYFVAGRSLCGDWRYFGDVAADKAAGEPCERCRAAEARRAALGQRLRR